MDGVAAIQARINQIEGLFGANRTIGAGGVLGAHQPKDASSADVTNFADALSNAQALTDTADAGSTIGSLNKAGVDPVQWANDFLSKLGMPVTSENVRAMKAWQQAEGTAARFNPLATTQGGFDGATRFNSVGVKNYMTYQDGIDANIKAITNGRYGNILSALQAGTDAMSVGTAIKNSPWGTGGLVERILSR
jgi:hypothetical protein